MSFNVPLHQCVAFMSVHYLPWYCVDLSLFVSVSLMSYSSTSTADHFSCPPSPHLTQATSCDHTANHQERLTWTLKSWTESRHGNTYLKVLVEYIVKDKELRSIAIIGCKGKFANVLLEFSNRYINSQTCILNHNMPLFVQIPIKAQTKVILHCHSVALTQCVLTDHK